MAKRKYRQRDSGLLVANDSIEPPKPKIPRPWYVGRFTPMAGRAVGQVQFYGSPAKVLFVDGKVAFDPACCCGSDPCEFCEDNDAPTEVYVNISGVTNVNCLSCDEINGDYVLTQSPTGPCSYWYYFSGFCGFGGGLHIVLQFTSDYLIVSTVAETRWRKSISSPYQCRNMSSVDIPFWRTSDNGLFGLPIQCDWSSSVVSVSSN